jgi:hypothetical protein
MRARLSALLSVALALTGFVSVTAASVAASQEGWPDKLEPRRTAPRQASRVRSAQDIPDLRRLRGSEIKTLLTDRGISNELQYEEFDASGEWFTSIRSRALITFGGSWVVEGDKVCVTTERQPNVCREVYVQESTKTVWMPEYHRPTLGHLFSYDLVDKPAHRRRS